MHHVPCAPVIFWPKKIALNFCNGALVLLYCEGACVLIFGVGAQVLHDPCELVLLCPKLHWLSSFGISALVLIFGECRLVLIFGEGAPMLIYGEGHQCSCFGEGTLAMVLFCKVIFLKTY